MSSILCDVLVLGDLQNSIYIKAPSKHVKNRLALAFVMHYKMFFIKSS